MTDGYRYPKNERTEIRSYYKGLDGKALLEHLHKSEDRVRCVVNIDGEKVVLTSRKPPLFNRGFICNPHQATAVGVQPLLSYRFFLVTI